jgi:hypothetical protein
MIVVTPSRSGHELSGIKLQSVIKQKVPMRKPEHGQDAVHQRDGTISVLPSMEGASIGSSSPAAPAALLLRRRGQQSTSL